MVTLKVSELKLKQIHQARQESGRKKDDEQWLLAASRILKPEQTWLPGGPYAYGCSQGTWGRFLAGQPVGAPAFKAFCQILGFDWQMIADRTDIDINENTNGQYFDWSGCPEVDVFYDRTSELTKLCQWVGEDNCRLVAILGMGGIGKTTLAVQLAKELQDRFDVVIWRSLQYAPTHLKLLGNLVQLVTNNKAEAAATETLEQGTSRLIRELRSRRCLVILDGLESLLSSNQLAGKYRTGYEEYGKLFRQIGSSLHQSCFVLTSHEKPREIVTLEGHSSPVRCLKLSGLEKKAARQLLQERGLIAESEWDRLIQRYRGNPLALKIVSDTILELFNGKTSEFLQQNTIFVGQVSEVLDRQLERLSDVETKVLYRLATAEAPLCIPQIREKISPAISHSQVIEILESLARRSLIEKIINNQPVLFTLQPVVMKYMINRFKHILH